MFDSTVRYGIVAGSPALDTIKDPDIRARMQVVTAAGTLTLLDWLRDGKVDAILQNVATLNYLNLHVYQKKLKIALVVDDHPANRLLLSRQLSFLGIRSMSAESGAQALEVHAKHVFDLMITDCSMPEMDGFTLVKEIRRRESGPQGRCLIIGYTADARQEVLALASEAGMDECLIKPVALEQLQRALTRHGEAGLRFNDARSKPEIEVDHDIALRSGIRSAIHRFSDGDQEMGSIFLKTLLAANLSDAEELAAAMRAEDAVKAAQLAHKIKGGAQLIDASSLIAACIALEQALASDPLQSQGHYEQLRAALDTVNRTLENPALLTAA
ncbi:hybrid sensor histidine kinase/response regulator [Paraherbaspirillum soli]|uniref:Response regulator n=1 Tax=Paraherbaspirillum soli TaxID=631222 RepID=A0ABW0M5C9_9BURK